MPEPKEEDNGVKKSAWKYRNRLPIQDEMANVIKLTIKAAEEQLKLERKKLRKMQYGG